jgi:hypothetical protein
MAAKRTRTPKALALPKRSTRKVGPDAWVLDESGNRTALTPQLADQAVTLMRERWLWPNRIAVMIGVMPRTLFGWVERGVAEDAVEPYRSFADEFVLAEAQSAAALFDVVRQAAMGEIVPVKGKLCPDLRLAVWLLERRFGEDWEGAGGSVMGVVLRSETESARGIRAKLDGWLRSLPDEVISRGRDLGIALDAGSVDGSV